jgi:hypothetical protein
VDYVAALLEVLREQHGNDYRHVHNLLTKEAASAGTGTGSATPAGKGFGAKAK